jgi:hypothetical protein
MTQPAINPRHLTTLAVVEGLVVALVVVRGVVLGGADLERPLHLAWLAGTMVLAGASLALYVVRAAAAARQAKEGGAGALETQALLGPSLGVLGLAFLLALAGPGLLERLLG